MEIEFLAQEGIIGAFRNCLHPQIRIFQPVQLIAMEKYSKGAKVGSNPLVTIEN